MTSDDHDRELEGADLLVLVPRIEAVGYDLDADESVQVIDGTGLLVLPGLINAHQHLYQVGLRSFRELERAHIHPWLTALHVKTIYLWRNDHYNPASVGAVSRAGMVESLLGGVTTIADQHYVYLDGKTEPYIEEMIEAALQTGIGLHAGRGSMTKGTARGWSCPTLRASR